jgi:hypothetical protein
MAPERYQSCIALVGIGLMLEPTVEEHPERYRPAAVAITHGTQTRATRAPSSRAFQRSDRRRYERDMNEAPKPLQVYIVEVRG